MEQGCEQSSSLFDVPWLFYPMVPVPDFDDTDAGIVLVHAERL